jgi:hypothetical protein
LKCQHDDQDGHQCGASALKGRRHCFFHCQDKDIREIRKHAQSAGGSQRKPKASLPALNFNFSDPREIARVLSQLAQLVYTARLDRRRAETISRLGDRALRALEIGSLATEQAKIKRVIEAEKTLPPNFAAEIEQSRQAGDDASFRRQVLELYEERETADRPAAETDKNKNEGK